jgi:hypothetical protein
MGESLVSASRRRGCIRLGRLHDGHALGAQALQRSLAVTGLELHGADALGQERHIVATLAGIERGGQDAVVGRQSQDDERRDAVSSKEVVQLGRDSGAADRVAQREAAVAVLAADALAYDELT